LSFPELAGQALVEAQGALAEKKRQEILQEKERGA
jgi:hypothetical protein